LLDPEPILLLRRRDKPLEVFLFQYHTELARPGTFSYIVPRPACIETPPAFSFSVSEPLNETYPRGIAKRVTLLRRCESIPSMTEPLESAALRARLVVKGKVQGVGYRAFAARVASQRGLCGGVRNLDDGRVELEVEGPKDQILILIEDVKTGPPAARVAAVEVEWSPATGRFSDFRVWY
jgi:acylphosphatase